ncbi:MAG: hypothetical protein ACOYOB_05055 [Myxococcota bacterium]
MAFLLIASPAGADESEQKFVGTMGPGKGHMAAFDLVLGNGTGYGASDRGSQVFLHFEGGGYFKSSAIGNLAGIEGGLEMGWDGVPKRHTAALADYTDNLGIAMDAWVGFPVTLLNLGNGKDDWLRWNVSPGMGASLICGYMSLKSALAVRLPVVGDAELAVTWWPDAASYSFGNSNDAINAGALKLSYFYDKRYHFFVQYRRSQRVAERAPVADDPMVYGGLTAPPGMDKIPFPLEERYDSEQVVTIGVGMMPF